MSLVDKLHYIASPRSVVALPTRETVADLDRILALPQRPPIDCERDPVTKKYQPAAQALIEIMTERFTRGRRVSCACRERKVRMEANGTLTIARVLPYDELPEPPVNTTLQAFAADLQRHNRDDMAALSAVQALTPGGEVTLPPVDGMGHPCITTLNAVQSWLLFEAERYGGAVGFCGVGSGKSIAFLLLALLFPFIRLAVLLIEPKQRRHYRSQYVRLREHFKVPSVVFDDSTGHTVPGTPPVHLISYSVLSQTKNSDLLDVRNPDLLMLDEGHRACGDSAINRRVKRFGLKKIRDREAKLEKNEPVLPRALYLIPASGTLESKSIVDTQMLCAYSLGTGSPLPLDPNEAKRWSGVIDPSYMPDRTSATAKKLQRAFGGGEYDPGSIANLMMPGPERAIREGFRQRRLYTPGIISASASTINAAIYLTERKPPKMPVSVYEALMQVRTQGLRPDKELLTEKLEQIDCARNVACGFYTYWAFPKHPCTCSGVLRCDQCLLIDEWYAKRKAYNKQLRSKLFAGEPHLDSEDLCWQAAERAWSFEKVPDGVETFCATCWKKGLAVAWPCIDTATGGLTRDHRPAWRAQAFPMWREIEPRVNYEERAKFIENGGEWLAQDAAEWAMKHKGVVWFQSVPFGRKVQELTGLPYFNGGPGAEERMRQEKGNRSIICSIKAHGAGTDGLQYLFNHQLICETPASNAKQTGYEQLLGRLHREGQKKDEVFTEGYFHVREMKDALRKAIEQAEFNFEMTKNRQKLLMADIDVEGV
jgi:hypothetical protein